MNKTVLFGLIPQNSNTSNAPQIGILKQLLIDVPQPLAISRTAFQPYHFSPCLYRLSLRSLFYVPHHRARRILHLCSPLYCGLKLWHHTNHQSYHFHSGNAASQKKKRERRSGMTYDRRGISHRRISQDFGS